MAGVFGNSIFSGFSQPWQGRKGYTDYGNLSADDIQLLNNFTGNFADDDIIWGNNAIKGTARKWMGKTPYAVSDDLLNTARSSTTGSTAAYKAAQATSQAGSTAGATSSGGLGGLFNKIKSSSAGQKLAKLPSMLDTASKVAPFAIQGYNAIQGLDQYGDTKKELEDMMASIGNSASSNPMATSYLTNEQMSQLRKLNNKGYEADDFELSDAFSDTGNLIKGGVSGAMMGLPFLFSNPYAMLATAALGAANAGIENANAERAKDISDLEGLYASLQNADREYNALRRPQYMNNRTIYF